MEAAEFIAFKEALKPLGRESIAIELTPLKEGETQALTTSKFRGLPYLPLGEAYPEDNGVPMLLWAQINFAEIPHLEGYPTEGILQVFAPAKEWCDIDDPNSYKILFHKDSNATPTTDFSFLTEELYKHCAIAYEFKLHFKKVVDAFSYDDHNICRVKFPVKTVSKGFLGLLGKKKTEIKELEFWEVCAKHLTKEQRAEIDALDRKVHHKIGGYANFAQDDPREYTAGKESDVLLFQIDSQMVGDEDYIMFGDCGIWNLFISPEDLATEQFNKAWVNEDTY